MVDIDCIGQSIENDGHNFFALRAIDFIDIVDLNSHLFSFLDNGLTMSLKHQFLHVYDLRFYKTHYYSFKIFPRF